MDCPLPTQATQEKENEYNAAIIHHYDVDKNQKSEIIKDSQVPWG